VTDEFPTLEVALGACVLWLCWRGFWLVTGALRFDAALATQERALHESAKERVPRRDPVAFWLNALTHSVKKARDESTVDLAARASERGKRMRQRLRSAAARDVVVSAVLAGCLIWARGAHFGETSWFYALGAAAALLLVLSVVCRLVVAAKLPTAARQLALALAPVSGRAPRGSCRRCGEANQVVVAGEQLGNALLALGVESLLVCPACGHAIDNARRVTAKVLRSG